MAVSAIGKVSESHYTRKHTLGNFEALLTKDRSMTMGSILRGSGDVTVQD
jgi:hypothetical protein